MHLLHHAHAAQARQRGDHAHIDQHQEAGALDVEARSVCTGRVAADGVDAAAEHGLVEQEVGHEQHSHEHQKCRRHARGQAGGLVFCDEQRGGTEGAHALGDHRQLLGVQRALHQALEHGGGAQGHDHRRQLKVADEQAVERAQNAADHDGNEDGQPHAAFPAHVQQHLGGGVAGERGQRRERYVEAAGDDDHELADGEDSGHDQRAQDVNDVVGGEELVGAHLDQQAQREKHQRDVKLAPPGQLTERFLQIHVPSLLTSCAKARWFRRSRRVRAGRRSCPSS